MSCAHKQLFLCGKGACSLKPAFMEHTKRKKTLKDEKKHHGVFIGTTVS